MFDLLRIEAGMLPSVSSKWHSGTTDGCNEWMYELTIVLVSSRYNLSRPWIIAALLEPCRVNGYSAQIMSHENPLSCALTASSTYDSHSRQTADLGRCRLPHSEELQWITTYLCMRDITDEGHHVLRFSDAVVQRPKHVTTTLIRGRAPRN